MGRLVTIGVVVVALSVTAFLVLAHNGPSRETPEDPYSLYDPIVAGEDFPGGIKWVVARDGIRPVYEPTFITAEDSRLRGADLVLGVELAEDVRAYPVGLLAAKEMVNDWFGDTPVLVSWCPLCGTGTVHSRELDGSPVLFGNQGALWGNAMTWWDHATGSIWSQPLGQSIAGPLEGRRLQLLPSTLTTWESWRTAHPSTLVLDGPIFDAGPNDSSTALVIELGGDALAIPSAVIVERGVINERLGGLDLAVVDGPAGVTVFSRSVDGRVLTLHIDGDALVDDETGTRWDRSTGVALEGDLAGLGLVRRPSSTMFIPDFQTFWPGERILEE